MKEIGRRKMDELGRVIMPYDLQRKLHITPMDTISFLEDSQGQVILSRMVPCCEICHSTDLLLKLNSSQYICEKCKEEIINL